MHAHSHILQRIEVLLEHCHLWKLVHCCGFFIVCQELVLRAHVAQVVIIFLRFGQSEFASITSFDSVPSGSAEILLDELLTSLEGLFAIFGKWRICDLNGLESILLLALRTFLLAINGLLSLV